MNIFSKRDAERSLGRADSRKSKRNRLFWTGAAESPRLEPRTMPAVTVTIFPIPLVALVEPQGITTGSDGNLWFTEYGAGKIGRMTPAGVETRFALPQVTPTAGSPGGRADTTPQPTAIAAGPDGALWFTGIPGEIGRITTAGVVTEFPLPVVPPPAGSTPGTASTLATASAIVAGPDGALWFTGVPGETGRISTTGVATEFAVPDIPPPAGLGPGTAPTLATLNVITVGPDGALWFTGVPGEVGRITTAGVVSEFPVPATPLPSGSSPGTAGTPASLEDITAGPDGALWFTGVPGEVGRISTNGVVTEYATPNFNEYGTPPFSLPGSGIVTIATGSDGNLWLTDGLAIGRMTPKGSFTSFNVPGTPGTSPLIAGLAPGPGGNVWFTEQEIGAPGGQPAVGEITPAGVTTLHVIPLWMTLNPNLGIGADATQITAGPDGALWFVDSFGGDPAIGRITSTGAIQQFPLPDGLQAIGLIAAGPDGSVWFTDQNQSLDHGRDAIGHISVNGAITEYPLPADVGVVQSIAVVPDGNVWFTENVTDPSALAQTVAIGRLTPEGAMSKFTVPLPTTAQGETLGAIANGPDGNVWFTCNYARAKGKNNQSFIGRITARGQIRLFELPPSFSSSSLAGDGFYGADGFGPGYVSSLTSGPNRKLWFAATNAQGTSGIAQISTSGKLGSFIPADISGDLVAGSNGQLWFPSSSGLFNVAKGIVTRSGVVATQDLPSQALVVNGVDYQVTDMTFSRDGSLWLTNGTSNIVRVSGLDAAAGGLDYRHRPTRAPDFVYEPEPPFTDAKAAYWTNTTSNPRPTFAGVAKPGAEVTLWAQKRGQNKPIFVGRATASTSDGSWTLTTRVKLSNGYYTVTASQTGDPGPPSGLYSLEPDSSGNLSNALVIQTPHAGKGNAERASRQTANT
jgi:streptogramin lyase